MYATFVGLLLGIAIFLQGFYVTSEIHLIVALIVGVVLLLLSIYIYGASFNPLHRAEQNMTPRLLELLRNDSSMRILAVSLFVAPFLLIGTILVPVKVALPLFFLLMGLALDLLYKYVQILADYLNPFRVIDFLQRDAIHAIDNDQDAKLCELIEAEAEIAIKALERHNTALANHILDSLEKVGEKFLSTAKSIAHPTQNPELSSQGIKDTLSYVLLFLLQHLEAIHERAIKKQFELVAGHIVTTLTKLATYAARVDLSLATLPLHYVNKVTFTAMKADFMDVGVKSSMGLLELVKAMSTLKDLSFQDIKPSMLSLIATLEMIAKETFRHDKSIKIPVLIAPFMELSRIIEQEPFKGHTDSPFIAQQINRLLGEFQALELVMKTMPPMPKITPDETLTESKEGSNKI